MMCLSLNEESPAMAYHLASLAKQGVVGRSGRGGGGGGRGRKDKNRGRQVGWGRFGPWQMKAVLSGFLEEMMQVLFPLQYLTEPCPAAVMCHTGQLNSYSEEISQQLTR